MNSHKRRLVALMFTDIVGYSSITSDNEELAFKLLEIHRKIFRSIFPLYNGIENKTVGDAFFIEFPSVIDAVNCAIKIQTEFYQYNASAAQKNIIQVRIGIHVADVIESDKDSYGDGVNIAARLESLADPGGISISHQVLDHVHHNIEYPTKYIGTPDLKNIKRPIEVYKIQLPWFEEEKKASLLSKVQKIKPKFTSTGMLLGLIFMVLMVIGSHIYSNFQDVNGLDSNPQSPKGAAQKQIIDLSKTQWYFSKEELKNGAWQPFDLKRSWQYTDQLHGRITLKTAFTVKRNYTNPAIVLGRVAGAHRVYLNDTFIGGSNHLPNIQFYPFDNNLLKKYENNHLVVVSVSKKSLSPGISPLKSIGTFLGEFNQVYTKVSNNNISFHLFNSAYLAVSFIMGLLCLIAYLLQRSRRQFLYFSLYLFLGSLILTYYNVFFSSFMDYTFHRYLKVLGLTGSSFVLLAAYFYLSKRPKFEKWTNMFIVVYVSLSAYYLMGYQGSPEQFLKRYNFTLLTALTISVIWVVVALIDIVDYVSKKKRTLNITQKGVRSWHQIIVIAFGVFNTLTISIAIKGSALVLPISKEYIGLIKSIGLVSPFLFAVVILATSSLDYSWIIRSIDYRRRRADLMLDFIPIMERESQFEQSIGEVLDKTSSFLEANRGSLYLFNEKTYEYKLQHAYGSAVVTSVLENRPKANEGLLGLVNSTGEAHLIKDVTKDLRTKSFIKQPKQSYGSNSCILIPLKLKGKFLGVATFADKRDGTNFSREDFALTKVIGKNLAILTYELADTRSINCIEEQTA